MSLQGFRNIEFYYYEGKVVNYGSPGGTFIIYYLYIITYYLYVITYYL